MFSRLVWPFLPAARGGRVFVYSIVISNFATSRLALCKSCHHMYPPHLPGARSSGVHTSRKAIAHGLILMRKRSCSRGAKNLAGKMFEGHITPPDAGDNIFSLVCLSIHQGRDRSQPSEPIFGLHPGESSPNGKSFGIVIPMGFDGFLGRKIVFK